MNIIHIINIINITTISVITDCTLQDTSYTGNWFCSQISVCERDISDSRECIKSKGCANEEQCTCADSNCVASDDGSYAGQLTNSGENPGGYTIDIYCCQSKIFPSDDLVAINYNDICNSASKLSYSISFIIMMFVTILFILGI
jgi:hypothetical protein